MKPAPGSNGVSLMLLLAVLVFSGDFLAAKVWLYLAYPYLVSLLAKSVFLSDLVLAVSVLSD